MNNYIKIINIQLSLSVQIFYFNTTNNYLATGSLVILRTVHLLSCMRFAYYLASNSLINMYIVL